MDSSTDFLNMSSSLEMKKSKIESIKNENIEETQEDEDNKQRKLDELFKQNLTLQNIELNYEQGLIHKINFKEMIEEFEKMHIMKKLGKKNEREKYKEIIRDELCIKLIKVLFEIVYILKFIEQQNILIGNDTQELLSNNRIILAQYYTMLLTKTTNSVITNHVIFTIAYIIHMSFFKAFLHDRIHFKIRFVLDCYHIVIFEINGIYVSDYYLQVMIEKIFTKNFFIYEQQDQDKIIKAVPDNQDKFFLGKRLNADHLISEMKNVNGGLEFAQDVRKGLRIKNQKNKLQLMNQNQIKKDQNIEEQQQQQQQQQHSHNRSQSCSNMKTELQKGQIKLNCIQISPTVGLFLENNKMVLPNRVNKIIQHSLEKMDQLSVLEVYNRKNKQQQSTQQLNIKQKSIGQTLKNNGKNMLDIYNVKVDYDEKSIKFPQFFRDMQEHYHILQQHQQKVDQLPSSIKMQQNLNYFQLNQIESFLDQKQKRFDSLDEKEKQEEILRIRKLAKESEIQNIEKLKKIQQDNIQTIIKTNQIIDNPEQRYYGSNHQLHKEKGCSSLPPLEQQNLNRFSKEYIKNMNILLGGRQEKIEEVYDSHLIKSYQQKYQKYIRDDHDENISSLKQKILLKSHFMSNNLSKAVKKRR